MATYPNFQIGPGSLQSVTSGTNNFGIGYVAGKSITTQQNNLIVGTGSGEFLTNNNTIVVGNNSYKSDRITRDDNILLGNDNWATTGNFGAQGQNEQSIVIGNSGITMSNTRRSIGIVTNTTQQIGSFSTQNVFNIIMLGDPFLRNNATSSDTVLIGKAASGQNHCTIIASLISISGDDNISIGYRAGLNIDNSNRNVFIGTDINSAGPGAFAGDAVIIGSNAGSLLDGANFESVIIGADALPATNNSPTNIFIGFGSGANFNLSNAENNNICIGSGDLASNTRTDNSVLIGSNVSIYSTGSSARNFVIGRGVNNLISGFANRLAFCTANNAPEYAGGDGVINIGSSIVAPTPGTVLTNGGGIIFTSGNNLIFHAANGVQTVIS